VAPSLCQTGRNIGQFQSNVYPCVYRELTVQKDDRDRYIDPYQDLITLADGRRLVPKRHLIGVQSGVSTKTSSHWLMEGG